MSQKDKVKLSLKNVKNNYQSAKQIENKINISAQATYDTIKITWDNVKDAESYDIEIDGQVINNGTLTSYVHSGLRPGTKHKYRLRVNTKDQVSQWSGDLEVTTKEKTEEKTKERENNIKSNTIISNNVKNDNKVATDNNVNEKLLPPGIPSKIKGIQTIDTIIITWNSSERAESYELEVDGVIKDNGSKTTFVHSGLSPKTTHNYRVRAKNALGYSNWSEYLSETTLEKPIDIPQNLNATATKNSITVTWDLVKDATGYDIEVDGIIKALGNINSYTHIDLMEGTSHIYRIRARKNDEISSWSAIAIKTTLKDSNNKFGTNDSNINNKTNVINEDVKSKTNINGDSTLKANADTSAPSAPTNLTEASKTGYSISLSWIASTDDVGVEQYDIYCNGKNIGSSTATTYICNGLTPSTWYTFSVKAKDKAGNISLDSNSITITTYNDDYGDSFDTAVPVQIGTEKPANIDYIGDYDYFIFTAPMNGSYTIESTGNTDTYGYLYDDSHNIIQSNDDYNGGNFGISQNLVAGKKYYVAVRAYGSGTGKYNLLVTVQENQPPTVPTNLQVLSKAVSSVTINWTASTDNIAVLNYDIYRNGTEIGEVGANNTSYTDTSLNPNTTYNYFVKAKDQAGNLSDASAQLNVTTDIDKTPPSAPTNLSVKEKTSYTINLIWDAAKDDGVIDRYQVYCNGKIMGNSATTEYKCEELRPNTSYSFTVKAIDKGGNISSESTSIAVTTYDDDYGNNFNDAAQIQIGKEQAGKIDYSGDYDYFYFTASIDGKYTIKSTGNLDTYGYLYDENGNLLGSNDDGDGNNFQVIKGLVGNRKYYVAVKAYGSQTGQYGLDVVEEENQPPTAPTNLNSTNQTVKSITLTWTASTDDIGLAAYEIYRNNTKIGEVDSNSTTYTDTGLDPNTQYGYEVKAKDSLGVLSEASNIIEVKTSVDNTPPTAPQNIKTLSVSDRGITIGWDSSTDDSRVAGYEIYCNGAKIGTTTATSFTYSDNIQYFVNYVFSVKAVDAAGNESNYSSSINTSVWEAKLTKDRVVNGDVTMDSANNIDLNGYTLCINGNLNQSNGTLNLDKGRIIIKGNYTLRDYAELDMVNSQDYVYIQGDFNESSCRGEYSHLTNGVLEIQGDFTNDGYNFCASDNNVVIFSGSNTSKISINTGGYSKINILKINKSAGVIFNTPIKVIQVEGIENIKNTEKITLLGANLLLKEDAVLPLSMELDDGSLNLNGHSLVLNGVIYINAKIDLQGGQLKILTDLDQEGTSINIDKGKLYVYEDYQINKLSELYMTDSEDYVFVGGNFLTNGYGHSDLSSGIFEIQGDFNVNDTSSFSTSGIHETIFTGDNTSKIYFKDATSCYFNILKIEKSAGALFNSTIKVNKFDDFEYIKNTDKITFWNSTIYLTKDTILGCSVDFNDTTDAYGVSKLSLNGHTLIIKGSMYLENSDVDLQGGILKIDGDLNQLKGFLIFGEGYIKINKGSLIVSGNYDLEDYTCVYMDNDEDYVYVGGNFTTKSSTGDYQNGILEVAGDFTELNPSNTQNSNNFQASGNNIVILGGIGVSKVRFESTSSYFNVLVIKAPYESGYAFSRTPLWNTLIEGYKDNINFGTDEFNNSSVGSDGTDAATGNFSQSYTDLSEVSLGYGINFIRTYNSKDRDTNGAFGIGWTFSFESYIKDFQGSSNIKVAKLPNGSSEIFNLNSDGSYTANNSRDSLQRFSSGYILSTKDQYYYGFNLNGYLCWIKDRNNNIISINVDSNGKVKSVVDAVGRTFTIEYNSKGLIQSISGLGKNIRYEYENNKLVTVYDAMNHLIKYTYDSNGYLSEIRDNDNNLIEAISYITTGESKNNVYQTTDSYGNLKTYNYDTSHLKTTITDSKGRSTIIAYDSSYNVISFTDEEGKISYTSYYLDKNGLNKYGDEKATIDRNGNITQYEIDSKGNITKIINPDGSYKLKYYDDKNNLIEEVDETGKCTFYIYDTNGINLIKKVQPLNGTDQYTENSDQSKFAVTVYVYYSDSEGAQLGYKAKGLLKCTYDPEGNIISYTYDVYGNIKTITDGEGHTTNNVYNDMGLKTSSVSPEGYVITYEYDSNGSLTKTVFNGGQTTRTVYDSEGRKIKEVTANLYDPSQEDASNGNYKADAGNRYTYYASGKIKTSEDTNNNITTYAYDIYGNLITETKPNGGIYTYAYDSMNRVISIYFSENSSKSPVLLETYSYSILSNKNIEKTVTVYLNDTDKAVTNYIYDYANRIIEQDNADGTKVIFTYNANGTKASTTDANGSTIYYRYDGLNRLTEQWTPLETYDGKILYSYYKVVYDKDGRKIQEITGKDKVLLYAVPQNVITKSYEYYGDNNIKAVVDSSGRKTEYSYDKDGYLIEEIDYIDANTKNITDYTNNYLGKPITKTTYVLSQDIYGSSSTSNIKLITTYSYDKDGNLISVVTPDSVKTIYSYDNMGRQISVSQSGLDEFGKAVTINNSATYDWEGKKLTSTDGNGNITIYIYDARGFLINQIDAKGNSTEFYYDNAGRKIQEISAKNEEDYKQLLNNFQNYYNKKSSDSGYNANYDFNKDGIIDIYDFVILSKQGPDNIQYTYDNMNRLKTIIQVYRDINTLKVINMVSQAYKYDNNGNIIKELYALGYEAGSGVSTDDKINSGYGVVKTYNLVNQIISILDADTADRKLSYTTKYVYDGALRKISEINANGVIINYHYNDAGNILSTTIQKSSASPEITMERNTYDLLGDIIANIDANGNVTKYEYNAFGKIRKIIYSSDATIDTYTVNYEYDVMGREVFTQDSLGKTQITTYDNQGRELKYSEQNSNGANAIITSIAYDKNGNKRFVVDGNNVTTENTYDELNRIKTKSITITDINGTKTIEITTYGYDAVGNNTIVTDWRGNITTYVYDSLSRLVEKLDAYNKIIEKLEYNDDGTQSKSYDALNNIIQFFYDKNKRLIKTIDAEGNVTSETYDTVGNKISSTDGNSNTTTYGYDEYNRLIYVSNAIGETTGYSYDNNGNMLTETDGKGNVTTYEYNPQNKLIRRIDNGGRAGNSGSYTYNSSKTESYTYYGNGNMKSKTDRNGNIVNYIYDIHNRLISEKVGAISISFAYDNNGNQLTMTDGTGTTVRTYDELNRVTSKNAPSIGKETYVYDIVKGMANGFTEEIDTDPKGNIVTKLYDRLGRINEVISAANTAVYSYYDNGNIQKLLYSNGTSEQYTYYKNNLLKTLANKKSDGTLLESYSYMYDKAGNMLSKLDNKGTTSYQYDKLERLIKVTEQNGNTASYGYDASGNRILETNVYAGNTKIISYSYNDENRLTSTATTINGAVTEKINYFYDNNGNQLSSSTTAYLNGKAQNTLVTTNKYDELNELVETITAEGINIVNIYDGEGKRVAKASNGNIKRYFYDGEKVVLELNESGAETAQNVYGTNQNFRYASAKLAYYLFNGHADVTMLIDSSGNKLASYYYDAFGNLTDTTETIDNPYRYAGYQYDIETGTYYIMARMYDPRTGRFMQEDSYRGSIKDPLSLNIYTYCNNEPLMHQDPTGHFLDGVFNWISNTASSVWNSVEAEASAISSAASSVSGFVKNNAEYVYKSFLNTGIGKGISSTINSIRNEANMVVESIKKTQIYSYIVPRISSLISETHDKLSSLTQKLLYIGKSVKNNPGQFIKGIVNSVANNASLNILNLKVGGKDPNEYAEELALKGDYQGATSFETGKSLGDIVSMAFGAVTMAKGIGEIYVAGQAAVLSGGLAIAGSFELAGDGIASIGYGIGGIKTSWNNYGNDLSKTFDYASMGKESEGVSNPYDDVRIINKKYAGQTFEFSGDLAEKYPNGVKFTEDGFPDLKPYAKVKVEVEGLKGNTTSDFTAANRAAGLKSTPQGYTWHHVEDGVTMELVPTDLHQAVRHTGGASLIKKGIVP